MKRQKSNCLLLILSIMISCFPSTAKAQSTPVESLATSIYLDSYGPIGDISVINKNHELWNHNYGTEKKLVMTDVAQIGGKGHMRCDILKKDGSLWKFLPSPTAIPGSWDSSNPAYYQMIGENLTEITIDEWTVKKIKELNIKDIKKIYAKSDATFFIKNDNSLWGFGDNAKGQMGRGLIYDYMTIWKFGGSDATETVPFLNVKRPVKIMENVKEVFACWGSTHFMQEGIFALKHDGTVWVWGDSTPVRVEIETQKIVKGLDSGKEYPRLAPDEFQNIKHLIVSSPFVTENGEEQYCYLKVNNDNTVWIRGNYNLHYLPEWTQIDVGDILGLD